MSVVFTEKSGKTRRPIGVVDADGDAGGRLMVPWISRIARPAGVWSIPGRGFMALLVAS